ncbi:MAG: hypothetical protein N2748_00670, partial [candidate division WOR-3 bacterium]|nr:hypothetical protein [candidate division WOR-3 bacterium]
KYTLEILSRAKVWKLKDIEEKHGLLIDACSISRKQDFERLGRAKYKGFKIKFLEEITNFIKIDYSIRRIKEE